MSPYQISTVTSNYIPHIISQSSNDLLTEIPDYLGIKSVVFALNMDSAPGLYDFGGSFLS